jgi:hypothetical protein
MRYQILTLCLLIGCLLTACDGLSSAEAEIGCSVEEGREIVFTGPITQDTAEEFVACIRAGDWNILTVNSPGGLETAAYRMARAIRDTEFTLVVDGICASACAIYLLPAAETIFLTPGSFIAYHPSVFTTYRMAEASGFDFPKQRDITVLRVEEHYTSLGLDLALFDHIGANHAIECIDIANPYTPSGFALQADVQMWVPTKTFMEAYLGRTLHGYPENRDEVYEAVANLIPGETVLFYGGRLNAELDLVRPQCQSS